MNMEQEIDASDPERFLSTVPHFKPSRKILKANFHMTAFHSDAGEMRLNTLETILFACESPTRSDVTAVHGASPRRRMRAESVLHRPSPSDFTG